MRGGLENIADVLRPLNVEAFWKLEAAEIERSQYLAVDKMAMSKRTHFSAIKDARDM